MTRNERRAVRRDIRRRRIANHTHPERRNTMDVIQTLVNEADNVGGFIAAAATVRNHIRTGRNPEVSHALLVSLSLRGHTLISQGQDARAISHAVLTTLSTEPQWVVSQPGTVGA